MTDLAARLIARNSAANAQRVPLAGESARAQGAAAKREAAALAHFVAVAKAAAARRSA